MSAIEDNLTALKLIAGGREPGAPKTSSKANLPDVPAIDDLAGLCAWLTAVFALDPAHPITEGRRQGLAGPDGHAELRRAGAPAIRLEPWKVLNTPARLIETLSGWAIPTDGAVPALKGEHCRLIAQVVRMLCGASATLSVEQESASLVGVFLQATQALEGYTTYGTTGQRYEAATALQRELDGTGRPLAAAKYLLDENTGEYVIRVQDLAEAARRFVGASLPRGWLDGRMASLDWKRVTLAGYEQPGRAGRAGPHARCDVYRGLLTAPADEGSVNT